MNGHLELVKWLYPGMRVKRWILVVLLGSLVTTAGLFLSLSSSVLDLLNWMANTVFLGTGEELPRVATVAGLSIVVVGLVVITLGIGQIVRSITSVVSPAEHGRLADVVYRRRYLAQGERIVVIGGGTGLATMLRGLKEYTSNITAVVTVSDDGGSSGRLVRDFGILPPGDVRNCITALADEEDLMARLLDYRFDVDESDLYGHSLGNLLLAAMSQIAGSFDRAVQETSQVLAIRGRVLPSTLDHVRLRAEFVDGHCTEGERAIVEYGHCQPIVRLSVLPSTATALPEVLDAIDRASLVVIGPGSLYTSVLPNLLLPEISDVLSRSRSRRIYICNVMTQPGETDGFSASDHVRTLIEHTHPRVFDTVLVNHQVPAEERLKRYYLEGASFVTPDVEKIRQMGYRVIRGAFMNDSNLVRHDADALARAIIYLVR